MRLGVHLPLADLGDGQPTGEELRTYTRTARDLGYTTLAANDHLVWGKPWLDGPTTLASVLSAAGDMTLATSITLPVVRHPVVVAKMLTTLASLAQGPVVGGLGPGSSRADYQAVGIPFEERWARFDEALRMVRALVRGEPTTPGDVLRRRGPAVPDTRPGPPGLVRQLGIRSTARRDGGGGGWLVRLGVQRDAGAVPRRPGSGSTTTYGLLVESRTTSPMPSPPCGCSSPTAAVRRSRCSPRCWRRR